MMLEFGLLALATLSTRDLRRALFQSRAAPFRRQLSNMLEEDVPLRGKRLATGGSIFHDHELGRSMFRSSAELARATPRSRLGQDGES